MRECLPLPTLLVEFGRRAGAATFLDGSTRGTDSASPVGTWSAIQQQTADFLGSFEDHEPCGFW